MATHSYDEYDLHPVPGMVAGEDLSSLQYTVVKYGTTDGTVIEGDDADNFCGILLNAPEEGEDAKVAGPGSYCLATNSSLAAVETGDFLTVHDATPGGHLKVVANAGVAVCRAHTDIAASKRGLVMVIVPQEMVDITLVFD